MNRADDWEFPRESWVEELVRRSLAEDIGSGDVSTKLAVEPQERAVGRIVARATGVAAGLPLLPILYGQLSTEVQVDLRLADGATVQPNMVVAELEGLTSDLLTGERTALNFLQHLSGIATLTSRYVAAIAGTSCRILDTRKTLPGYRALAKYAVRVGGGHNHRFGLFDRIMFKDNHWTAATGHMNELVAQARRDYPDLAIEIEVDDIAQLEQVLPLQIEWVLLDNFQPAAVAEAVRLRDSVDPGRTTKLEASGNIDLENVRTFAEAGVDAVSIGRLTHSAPALDLSQELDRWENPAKGPIP